MNFFFFMDTATTEFYTLSLHDALPICLARVPEGVVHPDLDLPALVARRVAQLHEAGEVPGRVRAEVRLVGRSEEHTSELQSQFHLVCRLLLEKKNSTTSS